MKTFFTQITLMLFFLIAPLCLMGNQSKDVYIQTTATIDSIEKARAGRSLKEIATIKFTTEAGKNWTTMVELQRVPFLGSFRTAGDKLEIFYNKANPSITHTYIGQLLTNYGMYILILLGLISSIFYYIKAFKNSKKQTRSI